MPASDSLSLTHSLHVLVVEDHAPLLEELVDHLQSLGHQVIGLDSPLEIDRLILLTKKAGFFSRLGFYEIPESMMPEQFKHEAILGKNRTTANKSIMMYQFLG